MLVSKKRVRELLRCPRTGSILRTCSNKLIAESNQEKVQYEIIDDYPILIDFENSVFKKEKTKSLSSVIDRQIYNGLLGVLKRIVSSSKKSTKENVEFIFNLLLKRNEKAKVLMIGGGTVGQGMSPFYGDNRIELVSFDVYATPFVHFIADAHRIPLPDKSFDAVIIQAVLEHVLSPEKVVSEIYRVLKSDGIVYAETPFLQHVHEGAYDFTRYTESGHRYLFRKFELIKSGVSAGAGTQLLWSLDNFFRGLFRSKKMGKIIKLLMFWLQYFDRMIPESYNTDSASGVFFLGKKQEISIADKEIITHYKGAQK